ncbi:MAG: lactate racemase domain-containing protein [Chloroflexi bacterium]|nr:lactate racemase domain-containing protein [Chloroflexota bacterium]
MSPRKKPKMEYNVLHGKNKLGFRLPVSWKVDMLPPSPLLPLGFPVDALNNALDKPLGMEPLDSLLHKHDSVILAVTDYTRPDVEKFILPVLMPRLKGKKVTILVAAGLHREMSPSELIDKFGNEAVDFPVIQHRAEEKNGLIDLGRTPEGVPAVLNRALVSGSLVITLGIVEPHQYAGYSGGYKTAAIGCASEETISSLHGIKYTDDLRCSPGRLENNPFQQALRSVGKKIPGIFAINIIMDEGGKVFAVGAGDPGEVISKLGKTAFEHYFVPLDFPVHAVFGGTPASKSSSLYQVTRAATYVAYNRHPVPVEGGFIFLFATCPEKGGMGEGERRFFSMMQKSYSPEELLSRARKDGLKGGEQRAFVLSWVLTKFHLSILGSKMCAEEMASIHLTPLKDIDTACFAVNEKFKNRPVRAVVSENLFSRIPVLREALE